MTLKNLNVFKVSDQCLNINQLKTFLAEVLFNLLSFFLSLEKFLPATYTEIHGSKLPGGDYYDNTVIGYSRIHESKGKGDIKIVEEALTMENEPLQPLPSQTPDETSKAGTSHFSTYLSSLEEYRKIRNGNDGPIGVCLETGTGNWTGTSKRLHRSKSEPRLNLFSAATTRDSDALLKLSSGSRYSQCQQLRTTQNCVQDHGTVPSSVSNTLRDFSDSSSSKENQLGPAVDTALRHKLIDRIFNGDLRKPLETSNCDVGDRRKLELDYLSHPHRSIIDVADDDSYQAHYDRLSSTRAKGLDRPDPGPEPGMEYGSGIEPGSGTVPSSVHTSWGNRHTQRGRSSDAVLGVMKHHNDNHNHNRTIGDYKSSAHQKVIGEVSRDKVRVLENRILDHTSGHLGNLRHSLLRSDLSRSGQLSFNEFRSAVHRCGVDMTSADLHEVFRDFADNTRGKSAANGHAVRSHDIRFFKDEAISIERYTEHLAQMHCERSNAGGTEHTAEHQRAFKKVLRASSKHADPGSVFRHTHCADPDPDPSSHSRGGSGYSVGDWYTWFVKSACRVLCGGRHCQCV